MPKFNNTEELQLRIEEHTETVAKFVEDRIKEACKELDDLVLKVGNALKGEPLTDYELDIIVMKLPVYMYYLVEFQERTGIEEDIAKLIKTESYSLKHSEATGTVADKASYAELETQAETLAHMATKRVNATLKLKLELANELLQSVKKVISRRMAEMELSRGTQNE